MQQVGDAVARVVRGGRVEARDALRALVGVLAGVDEASVVVVQRCPDCGGPHGRPVVMAPPAARDVGVSLAHAGEQHVVAAVRGRRIGVDAERADAPPERLAALGELLGEHPDPLRRWTQVEAALKADGRGLRVEPGAVHVDDASATARVPGSDRVYDLHAVELGDRLIVSLAVER
ncbi:4'-phosphopantetheinyl transferase family protein [Agrococcus sp. KRD186]|uniref:4'-phosphopantetheinyl transferase family protein n=1 Tax=Agrococcus sp. KRD186 TaxID=2729730 RepID=UPI0019D2345B|nr:4-phosphopantetheinyl transferase [Agrococcus sp. KRD186]